MKRLTVTTHDGQSLTLDGRRAEALAMFAAELLKWPNLELAHSWDATVRVSPTPDRVSVDFGIRQTNRT